MIEKIEIPPSKEVNLFEWEYYINRKINEISLKINEIIDFLEENKGGKENER